MPEQEYLTKAKFDQLSKELNELKNVKRKEIAANLEYAKSLGDLSENAEYQEARDIQGQMEERIAKLESILSSAVIAENRHGDTVDIGSTVVVRKAGDSADRRYQIVGSEESDMKSGKLSHRSPLGAALIGKEKGDSVEYTAPGGTLRYKVISVE